MCVQHRGSPSFHLNITAILRSLVALRLVFTEKRVIFRDVRKALRSIQIDASDVQISAVLNQVLDATHEQAEPS